jgi:hypothetical protein
MISHYGDTENVKTDAKQALDIINRQGTSFLMDCLAEHIGNVAIKYKLSDEERVRLANSLSKELQEAVLERV